MKRIGILWVFLVGLYGYAQEAIRPLAIGDTLPDLNFHQVIHYEKDSLQLADFRGKVLILDFWNTWCGTCLSSFPKLYEIQNRFRDDIMILPVVSQTGANRARYEDFYRMRKEMGMPIQLPSVVEDSVLVQLFPHKAVPHLVWIDAHGVVRAIDSGGDLNEENVLHMLNHNSHVPLPSAVHTDQEVRYDENRPLLIHGNGGSDYTFVQRSIVSVNSNIKGGGNWKIFRDSTHTRISVINATLPNLFIGVFARRYPEKFRGLTGSYLAKGIIGEGVSEAVATISSLLGTIDQDKNKAIVPDFYSYELIQSGTVTDTDILDEAIRDLNRIFKVSARLEERNISVLELYVRDGHKPRKTRYKTQKSAFDLISEEQKARFVFTNVRTANIAHTLNRQMDLPFIVDSTGLEGRMDVQLVFDGTKEEANLDKVAEELGKYGLGLRPEVYHMEVLTVGDPR